MRMNLENYLRNALPSDEQWFVSQFVSHLKELRKAYIYRTCPAETNEFFDLYRMDDNQTADDWKKFGPARCANEPRREGNP